MTTAEAPAVAPTHRRTHYLRWILLAVVLALVVVAVLWNRGALQRRPRLALVTASEDPYWDMVIAGAEAAAKRYKVDLTVIRSPGNEQAQSQFLRVLMT